GEGAAAETPGPPAKRAQPQRVTKQHRSRRVRTVLRGGEAPADRRGNAQEIEKAPGHRDTGDALRLAFAREVEIASAAISFYAIGRAGIVAPCGEGGGSYPANGGPGPILGHVHQATFVAIGQRAQQDRPSGCE